MDSKRIAVARSRVYIIVTTIAALLGTVSATGLIPQYTAAEARKHIGERATVIGKVDCIEHGRRHTDVLIGGCDLQKTLLWIVVPDEVSGSKLDCGQLRGVTIAVTGKIEFSGGTPQITINSTSQIVPRTPLNPDYFSSAMEKQSQGDFDGAIADLDRAVELTHEADIYVQRAEVKQKKGDLDGAISDYDQLLEHHTKAEYYLGRARLKTKKGDYAGVIVDSGRAIELYRHYYASHPNDHSTFVLAQAYSERGEAKEAMGDPAGAITDYENSVRNDPNAPIYKKKLKHAQAAAGPSHEQFSNNSKVTPESIAETFVQAYSGADVDAVAALYADRVDYTNSGVISNAAVRAQAKDYFARWPMRQWNLVGPVKTIPLGTKKKMIFSASYDVSNPQSNKHASGIAKETLIVAADASGAFKIVSQKEQLSKRDPSSYGAEHNQERRDTGVAVEEPTEKSPHHIEVASNNNGGQASELACKLVARGKDKFVFGEAESSRFENGIEILEGRDITGTFWTVAMGTDGKLLCAAKIQNEPTAASYWYGLVLEGEHLWLAGLPNGGRVSQIGKFNARTLQREASVQIDLPGRSDFHWQSEADFEISVNAATDDSIRFVVFSGDLRPIFDRIYSIPNRLGGPASEPFGDTRAFRLPDRSGYYLVVQPKVSKGTRGPRIGIIRLDNAGTVKWANAYAIGYTDSDPETCVAADGAILLTVDSPQQAVRSTTLTRINPEGAVKWSTTIEGLRVGFDEGRRFFQPKAAYPFTESSLFAVGTRHEDSDEGWWKAKDYSVLFRLNYETGRIEKQLAFGANTPGWCSLLDRDDHTFYVSLLNEQRLNKPTGHGHTPNLVNYHAAVLRFDYDFNLLAARKFRKPYGLAPVLHLIAPDTAIVSFVAEQEITFVESTNANLESSNACHFLDKDSVTFVDSHFRQHPANVASSPLTSITVSDANSKMSQADLSLVPLDLKMIPCKEKQ